MAFVDTLNALTNEAVVKKMYDNIFDATPVLKEFKAKQETGYSGLKLRIPVEYALNSNRGWFSGSDTLNTNDVDTATHLEFDWVDYYVSVTITGDDKDKNKGKEQIINLLNHKLSNARKTMSYGLTSGIFGDGSTAKSMTGLKAAVDDGTNVTTYGGLLRATYTWNKAKYTSLSDYISLAAMQSMFGDLTDGEEKPGLIITTQDVFDDVWELLTPTIRTDSEKSSIDYGFSMIKFNGAKIVVDAQCPAGEMYFINQNYLKLYPLSGYESPKWTGWKEPINQDAATGQFIWKGQLACGNCRYQGRIVSITT